MCMSLSVYRHVHWCCLFACLLDSFFCLCVCVCLLVFVSLFLSWVLLDCVIVCLCVCFFRCLHRYRWWCKFCITLRILNYRNYGGVFLIMGNAGMISSTVQLQWVGLLGREELKHRSGQDTLPTKAARSGKLGTLSAYPADYLRIYGLGFRVSLELRGPIQGTAHGLNTVSTSLYLRHMKHSSIAYLIIDGYYKREGSQAVSQRAGDWEARYISAYSDPLYR